MIYRLLSAISDVNVGATLVTTSYTTEAISPADAWCNITIATDGKVYATDTTGDSFRWTWLTGQGTAGDYQVYCTVNSGSISGQLADPTTLNSAVGTWLSCSTQRKWGIGRTNNTAGQDTASITLSIRSAIDGRVLATGTIGLTAKVV